MVMGVIACPYISLEPARFNRITARRENWYSPLMPRLFVAIDLSHAVNRRLTALCSGLPGARWLPAGQFHLTLRFIGGVDGGVFADIAHGLGDVTGPPFALKLNGIGHFPPRGRPRVLWAGVEADAGLTRLHGRIENRLRHLGIDPEGRKFAPHVTLARLKGTPVNRLGDYLVAHGDFITETMPITEFHLYSSILGAKGAIHRIEASYPLSSG